MRILVLHPSIIQPLEAWLKEHDLEMRRIPDIYGLGSPMWILTITDEAFERLPQG